MQLAILVALALGAASSAPAEANLLNPINKDAVEDHISQLKEDDVFKKLTGGLASHVLEYAPAAEATPASAGVPTNLEVFGNLGLLSMSNNKRKSERFQSCFLLSVVAADAESSFDFWATVNIEVVGDANDASRGERTTKSLAQSLSKIEGVEVLVCAGIQCSAKAPISALVEIADSRRVAFVRPAMAVPDELPIASNHHNSAARGCD